MASIFTYDPNPPRISSPWSTPGSTTPTIAGGEQPLQRGSIRTLSQSYKVPILLQDTGITKLEPEPQEGSTEYKLHLLLRPRRTFTSSTTGMEVYGSSHAKPSLPPSNLPDKDLEVSKSGYAPSNFTRQLRLQQLTTQLLWRLQQSSPFHSSSPGDLVLPKLPEASPKLGVPAKQAALLPGLEESQGALYEIGVSDDGALVGLIEEELDESLVNLKAMASSLGCLVELLRKVAVGECEWVRFDSPASKGTTCRSTLWVAEALVRPDVEAEEVFKDNQNGLAHTAEHMPATNTTIQIEAPRSKAEQLRVTLTGSTTAGKSSLLGTLSTSTLDNGRGKSRLSLLRHRHEITSGVTSSVAQELLGYHAEGDEVCVDMLTRTVNYATPDVSSWIDIHHLARRLVFISDSPGQPRYAKSTFRTLLSWQPHWTVVCIPADEDEVERSAATATIGSSQELHLSLTYIALCLMLQLPIVVAITKMDLATKIGLRVTLGKVLSALKESGRKPTILSNTPVPLGENGPDLQSIKRVERSEIDKMLAADTFSLETVPIVLTSAVTGLGIGKLHALLSSMPLFSRQTAPQKTHLDLAPAFRSAEPLFHTDEVFMIPPSKVYGAHNRNESADHGVVLCGRMAKDSISVGDSLILGPFSTELSLSESRQSLSLRRSSSYSASLGKSHLAGSPFLATRQSSDLKHKPVSGFVEVRVVSIRNLRLPVRTLLEGQVGTVGVQLLAPGPENQPSLSRSRKGMILMKPTSDATAYRSITATFSATAFTPSTAPTLILGGHAMVYVNAIRAAAKVTSLIFAQPQSQQDANSVFNFDDEQTSDGDIQDVRITFRFVSSVEWTAIGDRVLVVPTASTTGPVAGQVNTNAVSGLSGFVGSICEVIV